MQPRKYSPYSISAAAVNDPAAFMAQRAQPQKKKRNFWLDQLSTGTGILGGIAGSFVSPILGTGAGASLGGALGETIENLIDPEGGNWGNVGKEALVSGVMGAGPLKLLKGAGAGTKALVTGADDVAKVAGQAAMTPLRQKAGQGVLGAADNLAVKNFRLTPSQLGNFKGKFGKDAGEVIRKYGFTNVDDITTKGIEPLQSKFDELVTSIPGVTKTSLRDTLYKKAQKLATSGPTDSRVLGKQLKQETDSLLKKYGEVIDANELNQIRRQFDSLVNYTEKAANPSRYGVNKRMADGIRETLQKADPTGSLKGVGKELQSLRQLSTNAARQAELGRGSLPLNLPTLLGGATGAAAGGPVGAAGMAIGTAAVNSNAGRRGMMRGAEAIGGRIANSGAKAATRGQTGVGIAGRLGATGLLKGAEQQPQGLEGALLGDQSLTNSANAAMNAPSNTNPMNANMGGSYSNNDPLSSALGVTPYSKANLLYDIQRDPENMSEYIGLYQTLDEIFGAQAEEQKPLSQSQQERADLIKALDLTEGAVDAGSINYGPIGSRVEGVKSFFNAADPETLAFKNTVSGLRAAITKARAGASLTPGELQMLAKYTPSETDTEQVVRSKLAQLRALYGYQAPTGGATLEDALMGGQYAY